MFYVELELHAASGQVREVKIQHQPDQTSPPQVSSVLLPSPEMVQSDVLPCPELVQCPDVLLPPPAVSGAGAVS